MNSKKFSPPSANLLPDQMVYLTVCTALLAALMLDFSSLPTRPACRERLFPKVFGVSRTVFIPKSTKVDTRGLITRSPNTLRPLTLRNCDCKVIFAAMCFVLPRFSIECIHPSQRCVTQRIMTDNIFEIETAAVALRTRYSGDPGGLLTDFSCAYPRVDHKWIFMVYCNFSARNLR